METKKKKKKSGLQVNVLFHCTTFVHRVTRLYECCPSTNHTPESSKHIWKPLLHVWELKQQNAGNAFGPNYIWNTFSRQS